MNEKYEEALSNDLIDLAKKYQNEITPLEFCRILNEFNILILDSLIENEKN